MSDKLQHKNILLIAPRFFDYYLDMIEALENMGACVDYFDERPSNSNVIKAILRVNKKILSYKINRYYKDVVKRIQNRRYDYVLIVKPEGIPQHVIRQLRKMNPNVKIFAMLWDSIANNTDALEKINLTDRSFSFDKSDCDKYNMSFRPLFYTNKYNDISKIENKKEIDLLFVGTAHSDRYKILKKIKKITEDNGLKVYFHIYIQSKFIYYIRKYILREFPNSSIDEFKFKPISQNEILTLVSKSKVIVDIQHPKQTGLTMRTIEMLGANKKLITTNSNIKDYDFYDSTNIMVINRDIEDINFSFFESDYKLVSEDIKKEYSIEAWLLEILDFRL